jgi:multidrug efflux system membrane fusion protein
MDMTDSLEKRIGLGLAIAISVVIIVWLMGGSVYSQPDTPGALHTEGSHRSLTPVTVMLPKTRPLNPTLQVTGETFAERHVTLRAQREGVIEQIHTKVGELVVTETVLATLDPRDLDAQARAAAAELSRQKNEHDAAKRLQKQKLVGQTRLDETWAAYTRAAAELARIDTERRLRKISAPFSGTIDKINIEIGDFVQLGTPLFRLIDLSDIRVSAEIAEADLHRVFVGQTATIRLHNAAVAVLRHKSTGLPDQAKHANNGQHALSATVVHIAKVPQSSTRTYRIEIAPTQTAPDIPPIALGMTASVTLFSAEIPAFLISPAIVHLNEEGRMGVKTVDQNQRVQFQPIELITADHAGLWVSGLSADTPVITVGQGYVRLGEKVAPHPTPNSASHKQARRADMAPTKTATP